MSSQLNISNIKPLTGSGTINIGSSSSNTIQVNTTTQTITSVGTLEGNTIKGIGANTVNYTTPMTVGGETLAGRRNLIINGAMQVAQRSTSETAQHTSGYITCDRWRFNFVNEDELRLTVTQEADGPDGFANSLKIQSTTPESAIAADEEFRVMQRIEAQNLQALAFGTAAAKQFTISFYVKSTIAATYAMTAYASDANKILSKTYTINQANTWERKSITFDGNTADVINNDNGIGLNLNWQIMAGSNFTSGSNSAWETYAESKLAIGHTANAVATTTNATWQITGVQLEIGNVATPFEHRVLGEELSLCQRYFFKPDVSGNNSAFLTTSDDTYRRVYIFYPTEMRADPTATVTWSGGSSPGSTIGTSYSYHYISMGNTTSSVYMSAHQYDAEL